MPNAVIVDAVRTAVGRRNGQLKDWHPVAEWENCIKQGGPRISVTQDFCPH